jgi:hypothetical protein
MSLPRAIETIHVQIIFRPLGKGSRFNHRRKDILVLEKKKFISNLPFAAKGCNFISNLPFAAKGCFQAKPCKLKVINLGCYFVSGSHLLQLSVGRT